MKKSTRIISLMLATAIILTALFSLFQAITAAAASVAIEIAQAPEDIYVPQDISPGTSMTKTFDVIIQNTSNSSVLDITNIANPVIVSPLAGFKIIAVSHNLYHNGTGYQLPQSGNATFKYTVEFETTSQASTAYEFTQSLTSLVIGSSSGGAEITSLAIKFNVIKGSPETSTPTGTGTGESSHIYPELSSFQAPEVNISPGGSFQLMLDFSSSPVIPTKVGIKGGSPFYFKSGTQSLLTMPYRSGPTVYTIYTTRNISGGDIYLPLMVKCGHCPEEKEISIPISIAKVTETTKESTTVPETSIPISTATPYIIISQYSFGGDSVTAGATFPLSIYFTNTSDAVGIENIVMTVTAPEAFSLSNSSNTFYIDTLPAGETLHKAFDVQVKTGAEPASSSIQVDFSYQFIADDKRQDHKSTENISIPVNQIDRFTVDPLETNFTLWQGEETPVTINFVNKGKTTVFNVSASIEGNITSPGQLQNLGNFEAGKSGTVDFFLQGDEMGEVAGDILITYEDSNMNIKEIRTPYNVVVQGNEMPDMSGPSTDVLNPDIMPVPESGGISPWIVALGVAGVLCGAMVGVVSYKKVKIRQMEDNDEDI